MNNKEIAKELYANIKSSIETKRNLEKQKNLTMGDCTLAGYGKRDAEKLFDGIEFIDFKTLQNELNLIKEEELGILAPVKNVNKREYNKKLKLINETCLESLILVADMIYKQVAAFK